MEKEPSGFFFFAPGNMNKDELRGTIQGIWWWTVKKARMWALAPLKEIYHFFHVQPDWGLSAQEIFNRRERWGYNRIQKTRKKNVVSIFLDQFKDFMILVLLGATLVSGLLGEYSDAITIIIIVIFNALLGFIQEFRAERSFAALQKLAAPMGRVVREGKVTEIPAEEVVPGDVLLLQAGNVVCGDVRLIDTEGLIVDESPLTGESEAVEKTAEPLQELPSSIGDVKNMVFGSTMITSGSAQGIVVATGMNTELGAIAALIQEAEQELTPLQRRLARLGRTLVSACLALCSFVVFLGLWREQGLYKMLMSGITLAVAAIPEGLPAIVTISLALGVQRMVRRNAIVRRLPAVETLGCATVICSDKTGTITQNKMVVKKVASGERSWEIDKNVLQEGKRSQDWSDLEQCLLIAALCNNAWLEDSLQGAGRLVLKQEVQPRIHGSPTEVALLRCAYSYSAVRSRVQEYQRIKEYTFDSRKKYMAVVCCNGMMTKAYVKGAPERILSMSTHTLNNGKIEVLTNKQREKLLGQVEKMTMEALRVIAVAYKPWKKNGPSREPTNQPGKDEVESGLIFSGILGLIDPPRPEVMKAVRTCQKAGIRVVMITGDHRNTAIAIARQTGILGSSGEVVTGEELEKLDDKKLEKKIESIAVFARVNPEHKLRIVRCLKSRGHIVAMTGDGVNDAPAVKEADIGISMGKTGTEVTREAAALVLADDNFSTIVAAVEEGRGIYDNIRKFIRFLLGCNTGEILTMVMAMLWGLPLPLRPIQILWINLITDGLPAMALGVDAREKEIMFRSPRSITEGVLSRGLWAKILARGFIIGITSTVMFALAYYNTGHLVYAQTMALATLVATQLLHVFECRSEQRSFWDKSLPPNPLLAGSVLLSFLLLFINIYHPFFQDVFQTVALSLFDWLTIFSFSALPYVFSFSFWCIERLFRASKFTFEQKK